MAKPQVKSWKITSRRFGPQCQSKLGPVSGETEAQNLTFPEVKRLPRSDTTFVTGA